MILARTSISQYKVAISKKKGWVLYYKHVISSYNVKGYVSKVTYTPDNVSSVSCDL